jgi:hypothetical protein
MRAAFTRAAGTARPRRQYQLRSSKGLQGGLRVFDWRKIKPLLII